MKNLLGVVFWGGLFGAIAFSNWSSDQVKIEEAKARAAEVCTK